MQWSYCPGRELERVREGGGYEGGVGGYNSREHQTLSVEAFVQGAFCPHTHFSQRFRRPVKSVPPADKQTKSKERGQAKTSLTSQPKVEPITVADDFGLCPEPVLTGCMDLLRFQ